MIASLLLIAALDTTPTPSAQPASTTCSVTDKPVTVANAAKPIYPASALDLNLGLITVLVDITVGSDGKLLRAAVMQSSNNMAVDQAALRAVRRSRYSPAIKNCQAIEAEYVSRVVFDPKAQ